MKAHSESESFTDDHRERPVVLWAWELQLQMIITQVDGLTTTTTTTGELKD